MKTSFVSRGLVAALLALVVAIAPLSAQVQLPVQATFGNLIAALNNVNVQTGDILTFDLRNVLQNADIRVLNNALNNNHIEILSDIDDVIVAVNVLTGQIFVILLP